MAEKAGCSAGAPADGPLFAVLRRSAIEKLITVYEKGLFVSDCSQDDILAGQQVLKIERDGLKALEQSIGADFAKAIDLIATSEGRVIVTGMGKSGHIGHKLAATFASTGTPSFFVHPAEASHGDLGMITKKDVVLALSNSGETHELNDILLYVKRYDIPLIALCGRHKSTLGDKSTVLLVVPSIKEACPMGLAPTTSTTCMLALGDALAVALLQRRGFTPGDFAVFHPGGKLGARLIRVDELMHKGEDLPVVSEQTPVADAILEMTRKRLGCTGVVDEQGALCGIITDGDLRRHMGDEIMKNPVSEIMTPNPRTIEPKALAVEALNEMNSGGERPVFILFVVDKQNRPLGALHLHDCLRAGIA